VIWNSPIAAQVDLDLDPDRALCAEVVVAT
jgi:hypothetical protein